jgi:hypothetical protein
MLLHSLAISIHVITAILGLGQISGIAVLSSSMSAPGAASIGSWTALQRLARGTTWTLVIMLLSGVLLEYTSGGAFHDSWWFRLSFFGLLVLGAINGTMGRAIRKHESVGDDRTLKGVVRSSWIMCAITAAIAVLMEVKQPW